MNSQHFFCDKKNLKFLLDSEQSNILSSGKLDKIIIKNKIDLREINQIIKDNSKFYSFSKINDNFSKNLIKFDLNTKPKVLDLFCGAGGFSKGFDMSGFNISHSIDVNKVFIKTHKINFKESNSLSVDLNNFNPENLNLKRHHFDVIIGSPPCQTFSSIGQGKIKSLNKDIKKDIRNYLYSNFIKFVDFFQPKFFLLENVPGFKTKYNGEMFKDFINKLKNMYDISSDLINAKNFNVPQSRKRLFIFGQLKTYKKKLMIFDEINNIKDKKFYSKRCDIRSSKNNR
jgi:DNA-cytosine methyltransferase